MADCVSRSANVTSAGAPCRFTRRIDRCRLGRDRRRCCRRGEGQRRVRVRRRLRRGDTDLGEALDACAFRRDGHADRRRGDEEAHRANLHAASGCRQRPDRAARRHGARALHRVPLHLRAAGLRRHERSRALPDRAEVERECEGAVRRSPATPTRHPGRTAGPASTTSRRTARWPPRATTSTSTSVTRSTPTARSPGRSRRSPSRRSGGSTSSGSRSRRCRDCGRARASTVSLTTTSTSTTSRCRSSASRSIAPA